MWLLRRNIEGIPRCTLNDILIDGLVDKLAVINQNEAVHKHSSPCLISPPMASAITYLLRNQEHPGHEPHLWNDTSPKLEACILKLEACDL
jgi:hypothetical protein